MFYSSQCPENPWWAEQRFVIKSSCRFLRGNAEKQQCKCTASVHYKDLLYLSTQHAVQWTRISLMFVHLVHHELLRTYRQMQISTSLLTDALCCTFISLCCSLHHKLLSLHQAAQWRGEFSSWMMTRIKRYQNNFSNQLCCFYNQEHNRGQQHILSKVFQCCSFLRLF